MLSSSPPCPDSTFSSFADGDSSFFGGPVGSRQRVDWEGNYFLSFCIRPVITPYNTPAVVRPS